MSVNIEKYRLYSIKSHLSKFIPKLFRVETIINLKFIRKYTEINVCVQKEMPVIF